jgi:hypothetical protein
VLRHADAVVRASLDGGGTWELAVPFREALAEPDHAWFVVRSALERRPPERPVEELEVDLVGLSAESGKQAAMFDGKAKLRRQVEEASAQPKLPVAALLAPVSQRPTAAPKPQITHCDTGSELMCSSRR